jgi:hypothetical protein
MPWKWGNKNTCGDLGHVSLAIAIFYSRYMVSVPQDEQIKKLVTTVVISLPC